MRRAAAALAALLLALTLPASALAHATLQATIPERGAKLDKPPAEVTFRFDESVEASFGALRVFDSKGQEVQTGKAYHPDGKGAEISVKLKPGLGDGTYTATYRVVSADGHAVSSGYVFTVGEASAPAESLDQLLAAGGKTGPVTNTALAVARGVQYSAIALGLGALIFFLVVWRRTGATSRAFTARLERLMLVAAIAGVLSALAALVLQGAVGEGGSFWDAARVDTVREVLGTRFGRAWGIGALLWIITLVVLATRPLRPRGEPRHDGPEGEPTLVGGGWAPNGGSAPEADEAEPALAGGAPAAVAVAPPRVAAAAPRVSTAHLVALGVPLGALALLPSFGGHTSVQSPVAILLPANILHVLAMSAWLGGIAVLVFALRHATSELAPDRRTPLLADTVGRFSALASIALPVLLLSGVVQAIVEVRSFPALLDSAFGRSVLIKIVIALGIVALGYINRQELLPQLRQAAKDNTTPGHTGVLLRRTLRFELALGLAALAATGALSSYAPSVAESSGPYATTTNAGPIRIEVTVDPAKVGPNQLHLYLFDRKTGAAFQGTKELRVTAALPAKKIAPITFNSHVAGPGHYVVDGATLSVAGDWTISVTDRVSDFDEYETRFSVPIK
ncbi:copper resistance CopC/CopD family protein [Solirubrobacter soli]|uniref:copper resistance CopC/CopD family protein n=1 Tax=Solirubrobacter soli TaxID=363832 RepID=UPI00146F78A9|nr:copper resistance protein CopC [Solirubrobacter soli]